MLCDKLKETRERTGMNKREFADFLGIKYTTYNGYETGKREPAYDFLILFSRKLDVSIDYLLEVSDERDVLHSYSLKSNEYDLVKKYRALDDHGKYIVNLLLQTEFDRCNTTSAVDSLIDSFDPAPISDPKKLTFEEFIKAELEKEYDPAALKPPIQMEAALRKRMNQKKKNHRDA